MVQVKDKTKLSKKVSNKRVANDSTDSSDFSEDSDSESSLPCLDVSENLKCFYVNSKREQFHGMTLTELREFVEPTHKNIKRVTKAGQNLNKIRNHGSVSFSKMVHASIKKTMSIMEKYINMCVCFASLKVKF